MKDKMMGLLALMVSIWASVRGDKAVAKEMLRYARIGWYGYIRTIRMG